MGQVESRHCSSNKEIFSWDPWGQLIGVSSDAYTWKASYDALGRRLQTCYTTEEKESFVTSLYDPEEEFLEIGVKQDNKTFWKLYGPNSCDAIVDETGAVALIRDATGNLVELISAQDTVLIQEHLSCYGPQNKLPLINPDLFSFARSIDWQSKSVDPTGLIWMGARYYDPLSGRFLSPDPVGYPFCMDLYLYANGDPINFIDPDGRFASAAYSTIKSTVIDIWSNPRFHGAMQICGGLTEAAAGAGYSCGSGGFGAVFGGGFLMAHGLDSAITGLRQAVTGQPFDLACTQLLKAANVSSNMANGIEFGLGMLASSGMNGYRGASFIGKLFGNPVEKQLQQLESTLARQQFLNDISRNVSRKTVNITNDYRKNLIRYTGFDPGKAAEAHHVFPQRFRKEFVKIGIQIDNPKYLVWWEKEAHRSNAKAYNLAWHEFMYGKTRTIQEIEAFGKGKMSKQRIPVNY